MAGPCSLYLYSSNKSRANEIFEKCKQEIDRFEKKFSRYHPESIISVINQAAGNGQPVKVDTETASMLDYADTAWAESDGLFDITSGCLRKIWNFKSGKIPAQNEIKECLKNIGWDKVGWDKTWVYLPQKGMEIDFGGFGKEYAADLLARICRNEGIKHGLVDLSGDLSVIGEHPGGTPWLIGIRDPDNREKAKSHKRLSSGGLATSGNYERSFDLNGKRYSHIINPKTGWPVDSFSSVTVLADHALLAGTASTVAMLKGVTEGKQWLESMALEHVCI